MRNPALLTKDYSFMLLFPSIVSALTWLPCWALSAPPSQLCLCLAPYKEPWAPLPIVFSLSGQTPLLLHTLLAVWYLGPLSHYSPRTSSLNCWCFTACPCTLPSEIPITTKNIRNETISMYYFNRSLKNKKLLQQLPSQYHRDCSKTEKPKKQQLENIFKSLYSFLSQCGKRD